LKKVQKLRAREYLEEAPNDVERVLGLTVSTEDGAPQALELYRGRGEEDGEAWYARTDHNGAWVGVYRSQASDAANDVNTLFDAAPAQDGADDQAEATG
jgi:hypothetical protein